MAGSWLWSYRALSAHRPARAPFHRRRNSRDLSGVVGALATKNPGTEKKPRGARVVPFQTTAWLPLPVPFAPAAVPKLLMLLANPGPRLVGVVPFQMTALVPLAPVSEPATCPALLIACVA
jgi:hypothetical protein